MFIMREKIIHNLKDNLTVLEYYYKLDMTKVEKLTRFDDIFFVIEQTMQAANSPRTKKVSIGSWKTI